MNISSQVPTEVAYSIYIDTDRFRHKKTDETPNNNSFDFNPNEEPQVTDVLNKIYPTHNEQWIDASFIKSCPLCETKFGYDNFLGKYMNKYDIFNTKQHCRACGYVFCGNCCKKTIVIPKIIKKPKETYTVKQQLTGIYKTIPHNVVCDVCYDKIKNLEKIITNLHVA